MAADEGTSEPVAPPNDPERLRRREALLADLAAHGSWRQRLRARRRDHLSAREALVRHLRDTS